MALSAVKIAKAKDKGIYADGGGLYLQVNGTGAKSWLFRYQIAGARRWMGLGSFLDGVTLAEARELAADARKLLARGIDPLEAKKAAKVQEKAEAAKGRTFEEAATEYLAINNASWGNEKHRRQWKRSLELHVYPSIGETAVGGVESSAIAALLQPLYLTRRETAKRVRGRIEAVMSYAIVRGYRQGPNPALWRGFIEHLVTKPGREPARHFPALHYDQIPDFMGALRGEEGISALALAFTILTAARTGETIYARWPEFDLDEAVWTVPAKRMKMRREHRVPLSPAAVAIVKKMLPFKTKEDGFVFPGAKDDKPLSDMAMLMALRRLAYGHLTTHGMRSTFKDWASDLTSYHPDLSEAALAHAVKDKTEASYRRSDMFAKRRNLMEDWAAFCGWKAKTGKVVSLRRKNK